MFSKSESKQESFWVSDGAYLSMNLIGLYVIVPLSFATLLTGFVQSMGTEWGLVRHYWILLKLVLTIGSTLLLLLRQFTAVAGAAKAAAPIAATAGRRDTLRAQDFPRCGRRDCAGGFVVSHHGKPRPLSRPLPHARVGAELEIRKRLRLLAAWHRM